MQIGIPTGINLQDIKTCDLVEELSKRGGVEIKDIEPYQDKEISVNGPARVFIVID